MSLRSLGAVAVCLSPAQASIWPPPQAMSEAGEPALVSPKLSYVIVGAQSDDVEVGSVDFSRLTRAADRATGILRQRATSTTEKDALGTVSRVKLQVGGAAVADGDVSIRTDYSYKLQVDAEAGEAIINAPSGARCRCHATAKSWRAGGRSCCLRWCCMLLQKPPVTT
jgi:hypothetical protein